MTASLPYSNNPTARLLSRVALVCSALSILLGVLVLVGWWAGLLWITNLSPNYKPMAPSTALCFILLGAALLLRQRPPGSAWRRAGQVIAGGVLLLVLVILVQFPFVQGTSWPLDIEHWLAPAHYTVAESAFHMSPLTAAIFVLWALAFLLFRPGRKSLATRDHVGQALAILTLLAAGTLLVGYWYGTPLLYGDPLTPVALHTAVGIFLISLGLLFEGPDAYFSFWLRDGSIFSRFTRLLLPGAAIILLLVGWINLNLLEQLPPVYEMLSFAASTVFSAALLSLLTVVIARQVQAQVNRAQRELQTSKDFMGLLAGNLPAFVAYVGADDLRYRFANRLYESAFNRPQQVVGHLVREVLGEKNFQFALPYIEKVRAGERAMYLNTFHMADGQHWIEVNFVPDFDEGRAVRGIVVLSYDITERKRAEEQIEKALAEKETLLRELYHRTNNMQIISALLELQASAIDDPRLQEAFTNTNNRIRAMALVHQKLYEAQDLTHISLKEYIADLLSLLMTSYRVPPGRLSFVLEMEDAFVLIDTAIPCGLILNELISNAIQHAFPAGQPGVITVALHRLEGGEIYLRFADDGVGPPPGFDFHRDAGLGLQNIFALAENQLRGQVSFDANPGVACELCFRDNIYQPRV